MSNWVRLSLEITENRDKKYTIVRWHWLFGAIPIKREVFRNRKSLSEIKEFIEISKLERLLP